MKVPALLFALLLLVPFSTASAQDYPALEIFGGYLFMDFDTGDPSGAADTLSMHGWNGSVAGSWNRWLALEGDVSGHYQTDCFGLAGVDCRQHSFTLGPRISLRGGRASGFLHGLFGAEKATISGQLVGGGTSTLTDVSFVAMFGAGLDIHIAGPIAIRVVQFDYSTTHHFPSDLDRQNSVRVSAGVVIALGQRSP